MVTMYNRILVPTDGSDDMARVIDHASDLARAHGAELHFLHVVNTASFASLPMETSWESVATTLREEGERALEAAVERAVADEATTAVVEGTPSREIVGYAREEACDLVVMGTHGRGGLGRLIRGSVAERVVRSATVPVLTVRADEAGRGREAPADGEAVAPSPSEAAE